MRYFHILKVNFASVAGTVVLLLSVVVRPAVLVSSCCSLLCHVHVGGVRGSGVFAEGGQMPRIRPHSFAQLQ